MHEMPPQAFAAARAAHDTRHPRDLLDARAIHKAAQSPTFMDPLRAGSAPAASAPDSGGCGSTRPGLLDLLFEQSQTA